ncbi:MAG: RIP metalloprotease RseP [Candidatus Margulisiibacteriota bacterium]
MLISILSFAVVFTVVALVHEFGHYLVAKKSGIRVPECGIGFGPRLFSFKKGETTYSLNLIPILAYVNVSGESEEDDPSCPEDQKFYSKPILNRFLLAFMGPFFNIVLAFLILVLVFTFAGVPKSVSSVIDKVSPNSPAEKIGLKSGDMIISIDNVPVVKMEASIDYIHKHPDKLLTIKAARNGKEMIFKVTPKLDPKLKVGLIGFSPKPVYLKVGFLSALYYACQQTLSMIALMFIILWKLFTGGISLGELAGPVGIAQITGVYAQSGLLSLLSFVAFLNVNVGIINLLPLPALDGGRITFMLIELIRRKPVDIKTENKIHQWGLMALLALMAIITVNDVFRLFRPR